MKPKTRKLVAPRNPFVAAAMFRKAGTHTKPRKALRRQEKIMQGRLASKLGTPTTTQSEFQNPSVSEYVLHSVPVAQSNRVQPSEG